MDINGIQKLTLLDFPGRMACTVFLAGCDMRCPWCHNSELWRADAPALITDGELLDMLSKRRGILTGVVFTGGEALLRPELPDLIARVRDLGYAVKLDTNGTHPERLRRLIDSRLIDYAAMDIKNDAARYALTCGLERMDLAPIGESIALLLEGRVEYEFRTTVVSPLHDRTSFIGIGSMISGADKYFLQSFTDRDTVRFSGFSSPSKEELHEFAEVVRPFVKQVQIRGT
jgi:pyruvate formate lyase activating enzyme